MDLLCNLIAEMSEFKEERMAQVGARSRFNKSGTTSYLRLKCIRGTTIGNSWIFFKGSINVFTNRKLQKIQGGTF